MRYRDPMYTQTFPDRRRNDSRRFVAEQHVLVAWLGGTSVKTHRRAIADVSVPSSKVDFDSNRSSAQLNRDSRPVRLNVSVRRTETAKRTEIQCSRLRGICEKPLLHSFFSSIFLHFLLNSSRWNSTRPASIRVGRIRAFSRAIGIEYKYTP